MATVATQATGAIITNPLMTTDFEVRVRLIRASGGAAAATVLGAPAQRMRVQNGVDRILGQAGVEVRFEPEVVSFQDAQALSGGYGSVETLMAAARSAGATSPDPGTLNVVFVDVLPGSSPPVGERPPTGMALGGENGVAFFVDPTWLDPVYPTDQDNIAVVLAHEILHNVGDLEHSGSPENSMREVMQQVLLLPENLIADFSRLNTSQVAQVRANAPGLLSPRSANDFADYNNDGVVNAIDYTVWRDRVSAGGPFGLEADGNRDRVVDQADLAYFQARYGHTVDSATALPEPSAAIALAISAVCLAAKPARQR